MACPIKELSPSTTFNLIPSIVPGRTMMLMTMSDPCMDCLDNVGAGKASGKQLSIVWNGSGGELRIAGGDESIGSRSFPFTTTGESTGKLATTEDILCRSADRNRQLQVVGPVSRKLRVKAKEKELINTTVHKIAVVTLKQKEKKNTVLIDSGTQGGTNKKNGTVRKTTRLPVTSSPLSAATSPSTKSLSATKARCGVVGSSAKTRVASAMSDGGRVSPVSGGLKTGTSTQSLRSMLIFILAPKAIKLSGIVHHLNKVLGRQMPDEPRLLSTLASISTVSHDLYHLKAQHFHGLQTSNWPHYTSTELQLLQRRLQAAIDGHPGDSSDHSSINGVTNRHSLAPPAAGKRSRSPSVAGFVDELGLKSEKSPSSQVTPLPLASRQATHQKQQQQQQQQQQQRSQSPDRPSVPASAEKSKPLGSSVRVKLSKAQAGLLAATGKQQQAASRIAARAKANHSSSTTSSAASSKAYQNAGSKTTHSLRSRKSHAQNGQEEVTPVAKSNKRQREASPSPAREPERKIRRSSSSGGHRKVEQDVEVDENWKSNYSEVSSYSIRCRYKNDFNAAYPQYCDLKNRMEKVMEEFQRLEEQWKQAEGTPEEDRVHATVIALHEQYTKDSSFKADQEKFQFLHNKLSHIKSLINQYDSSLVAQS